MARPRRHATSAALAAAEAGEPPVAALTRLAPLWLVPDQSAAVGGL
jgi:hypothetical protein